MKFFFFGKVHKLNSLQVEVLKVALLDAQKQCEYERSLLSDDDRQLEPTVNKINRLKDLIEFLGLEDVCMSTTGEN